MLTENKTTEFKREYVNDIKNLRYYNKINCVYTK